ncbi:Rod shape-determining protein MreC [Candidatus Sulfopaludibacter sp. SbA6]|nr:Rod shape-determining protein MreC [Candidatus Sulfopaludibacter sp. SbA6]
MEGFLNRYRNITVLLLVIFAQLVLVAVQVKNDQDVRMIRVWTVSAVTPVARILEGLRGGGVGFVRNYITLHDTNAENRRLVEENGRLKLENTFLKNEVNRADRAKALEMFQTHTPSKMLAATVIGMAAGANSKVVFVDRGSGSGVMRGMAVVTPDGIVGKVIAAYPTASEVMLIDDPDFAAGVMSQKSQVRGTLKGDGTPLCRVDYVPLEEKVAVGEWFYTSGDDRVFPQGFPVGAIKAVRPGTGFQEILVAPSGIEHGPPEDVLILIQGVHQEIPDTPQVNQPIYIAPPPPIATTQATAPTGTTGATGTDADKLRAIYKAVGEEQGHTYGVGEVGSKPPDFTKLPSTQPGGRVPPGAPASRGPAAAGPAGAPAPTAVSPQRPPATEPPQTDRPPDLPPAKKQTAETPADASRRANQAAGVPKGPPH